MKKRYPQNEARWALVIQGIGLLVLAPVAYVIKDLSVAGSLLVGGLVCFLPNAYLYHRVFRHFGARAAPMMLKALYWGEVVKLLLTGILFLIGLTRPWILPLYLFAGYIYAQLIFWLAPIFWGVNKHK